MDAIQLTAELMKMAAEQPHCQAELESNRPFSHWNTHCINCGSHMSKPHRRDDCPPQKYESLTIKDSEEI